MYKLENVTKIKITDFRSYEERMSNNGGKYWFKSTFTKEDSGMWTEYMTTSADFDYCNGCGNFSNCNCDLNVWSSEQLEKYIADISSVDGFEVEVIA